MNWIVIDIFKNNLYSSIIAKIKLVDISGCCDVLVLDTEEIIIKKNNKERISAIYSFWSYLKHVTF